VAYTQAQVDELKKSIAEGVLKVRFADREVTYRSLDEMRQTLSMMQSEVGAVAGRPRRRRTLFATGKGL
jgi:hypothetical protein